MCVVFLQFVYINKVNSICCAAKAKFFCEFERNDELPQLSCEDCNAPSKGHCGKNGDGDCNIMGCSCSNGCRSGPCKESCDPSKREVADIDSNADKLNDDVTDFIIEAADYDGDGYLNLTEARFYVYKKQFSLLPEDEVGARINALDKNNDGYLSIDEIDGRE